MTDTTPLLCCACVSPCIHPRDRSSTPLLCAVFVCSKRRRPPLPTQRSRSGPSFLTGAIRAIGVTPSFLACHARACFSSARCKGLLPARRLSFSYSILYFLSSTAFLILFVWLCCVLSQTLNNPHNHIRVDCRVSFSTRAHRIHHHSFSACIYRLRRRRRQKNRLSSRSWQNRLCVHDEDNSTTHNEAVR